MEWNNNILTITENVKSKEEWDSLRRLHEEKFTSAIEIRVQTDLTEIYDYAFINCHALKRIDIPKTATRIGQSAFEFCENLQSISFPDELALIEANAFYSCASLSTVVFPKKLHEIGQRAFKCCSKLKDIDLPDSLEFIDAHAFSWCSSLKSVILPPKITLIKGGAFCCCGNLETVKIPNSVKIIGVGTFLNCDNLREVELPDNCFVASEAFKNCERLTVKVRDKYIPAPYFNYYNACLFFKNPSYERMIRIPLMEIKIDLALKYIDEDKRYMTYLKKYISKVIDLIVEKEDVQALDKLIEYKIINKKTIDKCLTCVKKNNFHEAFVVLAQYKNEIGGYDKSIKDRFDL